MADSFFELDSSGLETIAIYSTWHGFAHPPSAVAKLILTRQADRFVREDDLTHARDELPLDHVDALLAVLRQPPVEALDPALFDVPEPVIRSHFGSMWTDDNPQVLVRLKFDGGRNIAVVTRGQHVFLLPIEVQDSAGRLNFKTYQPALSRALASLMPADFMHRERLEGECPLLDEDVKDYRRGTGRWREWEPPPDEVAAAAVAEQPSGTKPSELMKQLQEKLHQLHMRVESPEEKDKAERSGKFSQRLLKRLPPNEIADILQRGGDPNVADGSGQTALMLAAFPPVDRMTFRMLARGGANLEARRPNDQATGLQLACRGGTVAAVEEWLAAGADVHARLPHGSTPLMLGAQWLPIVRMLLAKGARVNDVDNDGHTALIYAIHEQCWFRANDVLEAIRLLLDAGTDLTLRDREGLTPLGFARRHHRGKVLEDEAGHAMRETSRRVPTPEKQREQDELFRKMLREDHPDADPDRWNDLTMAEAVIDLIARAGGTE